MFFKKHLFATAEKKQIVDAIGRAERLTSGQIRVHIEPKCAGAALDRAADVFYKLHMQKTALRNGVLIYVAYEDKKLSIIGDKGINDVVPKDFWDTTLARMTADFKKNDFLKGILFSVEETGKHLVNYFPHRDGDKNELSNEISEG